MNKSLTLVAAGLIAGATLMLSAAPAAAGTNVDVNIGVPGVYVQPHPVYVQPRPIYVHPQYESDWRERQVRAIEWRDNPRNHGQEVSRAAHERKYERKHNKRHGNKHDD